VIKRELNRRLKYECQCDERLKAKAEGLEHLKIKTKLIDERFDSVMGECDLEPIGTPSIFNVIRSATSLTRMLSILDLRCEENTTRR
jgi:hypothetical protein